MRSRRPPADRRGHPKPGNGGTVTDEANFPPLATGEMLAIFLQYKATLPGPSRHHCGPAHVRFGQSRHGRKIASCCRKKLLRPKQSIFGDATISATTLLLAQLDKLLLPPGRLLCPVKNVSLNSGLKSRSQADRARAAPSRFLRSRMRLLHAHSPKLIIGHCDAHHARRDLS